MLSTESIYRKKELKQMYGACEKMAYSGWAVPGRQFRLETDLEINTYEIHMNKYTYEK